MNIENFHRVSSLHAKLGELRFQRNMAKVGITLDGRYQDDDMIDVVKSHIHAVLESRIRIVEEELISLGVTL